MQLKSDGVVLDFGEGFVFGGDFDLETVVFEALACLDVVLVFGCPVEDDFLAVVGDGVGFASPVAPLSDKVAILIVAGEEGVEVIVDADFQVLGDLILRHLFGFSVVLKGFVHDLRQALVDEFLHPLSSVVEDAVDAEVQVSCLNLKKLS